VAGRRVLYVDDEPGLLYLAKAILEQGEDLEIDTEQDPLEALNRVASGNYDVIVCDYQMPEADGIELLKRLRARGDRTPFILFTGRGREEVAIQALNSGADFYMQKGGAPLVQFGELKNAIVLLSNRRSMEGRLLESERRLSTLLNNLPGMAYRCRNDVNWTMEFVSEGCQALTGYHAQDLLLNQHRSYAALIRPEHRQMVRDEVQAGIREKRPYKMIYAIATASGDPKWVWEQGESVISPNGEIVALEGFIADITEQKIAEESLRLANTKLNLLSNITRHDIRNQLLIITSYIQLLKRQLQGPDELEVISKVEKCTRKVDQYIEFTKDYEEMGSINPLWQNVTEVLSSLSTGKEVKRLVLCGPIRDLEIYADPLLPRVFHNLLEDSIRYGGRPITVTIDQEPADRGLRLIYQDDGVGVPLEEKEMIFQKGYGKGTGLGLFLSREILAITGITIVETGEPGRGVRFEMAVPPGAFRSGARGR
jgi:PAS domain S-box-containing protein